MTIIVKQGQTVYDIAEIAYGDPSAIYDLALENPTIDISSTSSLTGIELTYTQRQRITKKEAKKIISIPPKVVTISDEQTIFDLSLQYYGKAEKVYQLLSENTNIESILTDINAGKTITFTESKEFIPNYFRVNNLIVATKYPSQFEGRITEQEEERITENSYRRNLE